MRGLSQTLHPSILEELGLESTIDWYLSTVEKQLGIHVALRDARARRGRSMRPTAIHVYRVLQEALSNVARHSGADARVGAAALRAGSAGARGRGPRHGASTPDSRAARARPGRDARARRAVGGTLEFLTAAARAARWCDSSVPIVRTGRSSHDRQTITVLLVDDHALVRRGFRRLLEDDPAIAVVGEASNGEEAIRLAGELKPHVVVMDCGDAGHERPGRDARHSRQRARRAILMLSMHSEETLVRQAMDAGARGYVLKNALDLDLAAAVKRVAAGETVLDPARRHGRRRWPASATRA